MQPAAEEKEAEFMAELCSKVTYVPLYKEDPKFSEKVEVLKDAPVPVHKGGGRRKCGGFECCEIFMIF